MKILRPAIEPESFFRTVEEGSPRILFLDYDGTLAPFREERDRAFPYPGVREALSEIVSSGSVRLVVISGRWTRDLIPLLGLEGPLEVWGSHGWERKRPGRETEVGRLEEKTVRGLVEAEEWARVEGLEKWCERKPACLALHWRGLAEERARQLRRKAFRSWSAIAALGSLEVHEFDGGVELRAEGRSKGFAVETVLAEAGKDAVAAYLGDDLTDEDAFRALRGRGLRVLVRREERPTEADLWLEPPEDLLWFLRRFAAAARRGGGRE